MSKAVILALRDIHTETDDPILVLQDNEEIISVVAGNVGGHATFQLVTAVIEKDWVPVALRKEAVTAPVTKAQPSADLG